MIKNTVTVPLQMVDSILPSLLFLYFQTVTDTNVTLTFVRTSLGVRTVSMKVS